MITGSMPQPWLKTWVPTWRAWTGRTPWDPLGPLGTPWVSKLGRLEWHGTSEHLHRSFRVVAVFRLGLKKRQHDLLMFQACSSTLVYRTLSGDPIGMDCHGKTHHHVEGIRSGVDFNRSFRNSWRLCCSTPHFFVADVLQVSIS